MPIKRDADGNIIEVKTKKASSFGDEFQRDDRTVPGRSPTAAPGGPGNGQRADVGQLSGYEAKTVLARSASLDARKQGAAMANANRDGKTRVYRPGAKKAQADVGSSIAEARPESYIAMDDPPVGWLVVVQGPGKGNVLTIGNGSNSIGRDQGERIRVDFGDELISRYGHSTITYDPRGKKFYLQHGVGKNLTYLEGAPVLTPTELEGFSKITIGDTLLLFVPLCCDQFDWEEYESR